MNICLDNINENNNKNKITQEEYNNNYNSITNKDKNDIKLKSNNNFSETDGDNNINERDNIFYKEKKILLENFKPNYSYDFAISNFNDIKDEDFPFYPNSKFGLSFYKDIALYLRSKQLNPRKPRYPLYINNIKDIKEISNEKSKFRHICLKFGLTHNNELGYFKKDKIKNKLNLDTNLSAKDKIEKELITKEYDLYIIPYRINEYNLLNELHIDNGHPSCERLRKKLESIHIFYYNYIEDIKYITEKCVICKIKSKNIKLEKKEFKPILFQYPKERYVLDITDIPNNIDNTSYKKYLLNIIDHFSKMSKTYLITNKSANIILDKLVDFINSYGMPKSIGTDNGKEFKNSIMMNFCQENNINLVHGLPYKPHSQGVVERLHRTIKSHIVLTKFLYHNKFNLENTINKINQLYNSTINTVTGFTPNEIFWSTNKEILKKVYYNTTKYYSDYNLTEKIIECGDKCVLSNKLYIKKKTKDNELILEENKFLKITEIYSIPGEIIKNLSGGKYLVLISKDVKESKLNENDIVRVDRNRFRLLEDNDWFKLVYDSI